MKLGRSLLNGKLSGKQRAMLATSVALLVCACVTPGVSTNAGKNAFTADIARSYSTAIPEAKVAVTGDLTLSISMPGGSGQPGSSVSYLDRVWDYCLRNEANCQQFVAQHVAKTAQGLREQSRPIQRERIRAVIRPQHYVQAMRQQLSAEPIAESVAGGLMLVCVVDDDTTARVLNDKQLEALNLSKSEAIDLAKKNLAAILPPINRANSISPDGAFGIAGGDPYYAASRLVMHDQWADLAKGMNGQLLATVPDGGVIYFADSANPRATQYLLRVTSEAAQKSERPISPVILVWSRDGWQQWMH